MSIWGRFKFLMGILVVFAIVGLLVLYLNNAMSTVRAARAEIGADTTTVGVDYPGTITAVEVNEGDKVSKGQLLFVINSPELTSDITAGSVRPSTLPFSVDPTDNSMLLRASGDGLVEKIVYLKGSHVPNGAVVATIDTADTLYISGHFHLTPPDYARLKNGNSMEVTFPDNSRSTAEVYSIKLVSNGNQVDTVVKARLKGGTVGNFKFPVGTPVEASLKLTKQTWYQQFVNFLHDLFKPKAG